MNDMTAQWQLLRKRQSGQQRAVTSSASLASSFAVYKSAPTVGLCHDKAPGKKQILSCHQVRDQRKYMQTS